MVSLEKAKQDVESGLSTRKLAKQWDCSQTAVRYILWKYGLKTYPTPRPKKIKAIKEKQIVPLPKYLVEHCKVSRNCIKKWLLREQCFPNKCSLCGINTWREKPLNLRLDHINGVNDDYRLENLRLICPNCDSQLPTYCGRNKKKKVL